MKSTDKIFPFSYIYSRFSANRRINASQKRSRYLYEIYTSHPSSSRISRHIANYSSSKAGVVGLTKTVARELASRHINCNAIAPGAIRTPMTDAMDPKDLQAILDTIPLGFMGEADDIAELAAYLASDKAKYITGEVIRVDGGIAMYLRQGSRFIRLLRNTRRFHGKSPLNIRFSGIAHACPPVPTLRRDSRICFSKQTGNLPVSLNRKGRS